MQRKEIWHAEWFKMKFSFQTDKHMLHIYCFWNVDEELENLFMMIPIFKREKSNFGTTDSKSTVWIWVTYFMYYGI